MDCLTALAGTLGPAEDRKILLAPHQVGRFRTNILLEYSLGGKFGNQIPMELLVRGRVFAGKDGIYGIAPVFEGGWVF
jgi:hypothetical protein